MGKIFSLMIFLILFGAGCMEPLHELDQRIIGMFREQNVKDVSNGIGKDWINLGERKFEVIGTTTTIYTGFVTTTSIIHYIDDTP